MLPELSVCPAQVTESSHQPSLVIPTTHLITYGEESDMADGVDRI